MVLAGGVIAKSASGYDSARLICWRFLLLSACIATRILDPVVVFWLSQFGLLKATTQRFFAAGARPHRSIEWKGCSDAYG